MEGISTGRAPQVVDRRRVVGPAVLLLLLASSLALPTTAAAASSTRQPRSWRWLVGEGEGGKQGPPGDEVTTEAGYAPLKKYLPPAPPPAPNAGK